MLKLGHFETMTKAILAPMAGITDLPYREINREFGCELAFTEMISAMGICIGNYKTLRLLDSSPKDSPLGIQIFGKNESYISEALEKLSEYKYDILDFNAACPAPKLAKKGYGAALLKEPEKLQKLIAAIVAKSDKPVTVKIRSGWDEKNVNAIEVARRLEDAGADAIFLHGRTRKQFYRDGVDYDLIRDVKQKLNIPLIASGSIFSEEDAASTLNHTGADAVLIARGSFGNPWIFRNIEKLLAGEKPDNIHSAEEVSAIMRRHFEKLVSYYGDFKALLIFRRIFVYYTKNFSNIKTMRKSIFSLTNSDEIFQIIDQFEKIGQIARK